MDWFYIGLALGFFGLSWGVVCFADKLMTEGKS